MTTATSAAPTTRADTSLLAALVAAQVVLFLIPLLVLGQAIGWPASLRLGAGELLPLIAREAFAVQVGYWGYLATVAAMVPLVLALRRFAHGRGVHGLAVDVMTAFGLAAAILKSLGIVRWLIAMPRLAARHGETADPALRTALEVTSDAVNLYAGSVGELLGVQLFSGLWMIALGVTLARIGLRLNGWASVALGVGFAACALRTLFPALEALQAPLPPLALAWLIVFAVTLWRTR